MPEPGPTPRNAVILRVTVVRDGHATEYGKTHADERPGIAFDAAAATERLWRSMRLEIERDGGIPEPG